MSVLRSMLPQIRSYIDSRQIDTHILGEHALNLSRRLLASLELALQDQNLLPSQTRLRFVSSLTTLHVHHVGLMWRKAKSGDAVMRVVIHILIGVHELGEKIHGLWWVIHSCVVLVQLLIQNTKIPVFIKSIFRIINYKVANTAIWVEYWYGIGLSFNDCLSWNEYIWCLR